MSNTITPIYDKTCDKVIQTVIFMGDVDESEVYDPITLFMNGEQGVYYDPSKLYTLFQDSAGTTPVTAAGQPVGLMLDESQGLELGPESCSDPSFDNPSAWQCFGCSITSGALVFDATSSGNGANNLSGQPPPVGALCEVTITIDSISEGAVAAKLGNYYGGLFNSAGVHTSYVVAFGGTLTIDCFNQTTATLSSVSVKLLAGNHASQPTTTKQPILQESGGLYSLKFDEVDDELVTTFPAPLGSNCTIGIAVKPAATILTGQTVDATYVMNTDNYGVVIVDDALTPEETANLTEWLNAKAGN